MKNSIKKEWDNLKFFAGRVWQYSPSYVLASSAESILEAVIPFIGILLPKFIIDELMGQKRIPVLCGYVAVAVGVALLLTLLTNALKRYMRAGVRDIMTKFEAGMGEHSMGVAYEHLEDVHYIELKNRAMLPIRDRMTHWFMVKYLPDMVRYIFVTAGTVGIIVSFGSLSLLVILLPTVLIALLNKRYQKKDMEVQKGKIKMERSFLYYSDLIDDFGPGKDIRLFNIHTLLMKRNNECDRAIWKSIGETFSLRYGFEGTSKALEAFRTAFVYGYIGIKALLEGIGVGSFTMYIAAVATFSDAVSRLLENVITLRQDCRYLEPYIELEQVPMEEKRGGITDIGMESPPSADHREGDLPLCLEFSHVSFHYPGSDHNVLNDVSFKIDSGDSISIVGRNGAGKTTIIKLISRLFRPSEGKILMNGIDIQEIDFLVYQKALAVVFQDFKILQFSVAENVAAGEEVDRKRLNRALSTAGIMEKINSLESGADTYAGKQFDENGTEFSGGELQKLAIARALYKDSPVIVLDEPTAALDPYAEEEVYERFHELTGGKSAVYISHRLSSCKFCKRILLIDGGRIAEDGNHEELMEMGGRYAEMFKLQASQYVS